MRNATALGEVTDGDMSTGCAAELVSHAANRPRPENGLMQSAGRPLQVGDGEHVGRGTLARRTRRGCSKIERRPCCADGDYHDSQQYKPHATCARGGSLRASFGLWPTGLPGAVIGGILA